MSVFINALFSRKQYVIDNIMFLFIVSKHLFLLFTWLWYKETPLLFNILILPLGSLIILRGGES